MSQLNIRKSDIVGPDRSQERSANLSERLQSLVLMGQDNPSFGLTLLHLIVDLVSADSGVLCQATDGVFSEVAEVGASDQIEALLKDSDYQTFISGATVQQRPCSAGDSALVFTAKIPVGGHADADDMVAAVLVRNATPFAIALAHERLELVVAICRAKANGSFLVGDQALSPQCVLGLAKGLIGSGSLADRDHSFVDAISAELSLPGLVLARLSGAKVATLAFAHQGRPHAGSLIAAKCKSDIERAISYRTGMPSATSSNPQSDGDWWVERVCLDGTEIAVLACPRVLVTSNCDRVQNAMVGAADVFAPFIAAATRQGNLQEAAADFVGRRKLHRWVLAASLAAACLAVVPWPDRVAAPFRVVSEERRVITAPFDGVLKAVYVDVDDRVAAGETSMARLATRDLDLSIASNLSKRAAALTEQALAHRQFKPADARIAELRAQKAKAEIDLLKFRRSQAVVTSPISGTVTDAEIRKRVGSVISRGDTLFHVADTALLQSEVYIPDDKVAAVKVGQKGRLALAARPGETFDFEITRVFPRAETVGARTVFRAIAKFKGDKRNQLRSGMEGIAQIETGASTVGWLLIRDAVNFVRSYFWI